MPLVAGVDSSTQSCKVVVRDATTGAQVRRGQAPHPSGTSVDPEAWWNALQLAVGEAGGIDDVASVSVAGQQHGMVCLDDRGSVVREALLWNDMRSARAAQDLVDELPGGAAAWATSTGSVPMASFTVTKLRWLAENEPENAASTAAVCLPHDWLSWRLRGTSDIGELCTDRSEASGTGYWSPAAGAYRTDLLELAFGKTPVVPSVGAPSTAVGQVTSGALLGAGAGDNAAAALGLGTRPGDVVISVGTSGVASAVSTVPTADPSGLVAGFADATGHFLPLACTLNGARVLLAAATILGCDLDGVADLALAAREGADGLVLVPYFDGERTPNRPEASAAIHGLRLDNSTPTNIARAAVEGLLCGLADCLDALRSQGVTAERVLLVGGGARNEAVRRLAPGILGLPVYVPSAGEYVADGAARQAAWALDGESRPPDWATADLRRFDADPQPEVRERYAEARELTIRRTRG
ncbi:xylulokinase [Nocardioides marmorisolisilvae]|uniref:Xylulose kinase n=1 Tax=Nocardioides marmorisolisilvae TaxID=1542737 RepID=A0A3N0DPT5_9ACTN|nr:FGGY family carbohydrate kinase [Nocardioides marmorisolisilvae]RNL77635.1 xylulose kinase [Nocardioides marmorisolisilvae]